MSVHVEYFNGKRENIFLKKILAFDVTFGSTLFLLHLVDFIKMCFKNAQKSNLKMFKCDI